MSHSNYSIGPWTLGKRKKHVQYISSEKWGHFAKVVVRLEGATEDEGDGLANVQLILAAPDLLTALKHCVIEGKEWLAEARAAIAKAEGQQ